MYSVFEARIEKIRCYQVAGKRRTDQERITCDQAAAGKRRKDEARLRDTAVVRKSNKRSRGTKTEN